MALETNSVVAELDDVPNQPLRFTEDPKPRSEDGIIAYQQAKFAHDRNPLDLVRLPMVKSGTQAMTAIQQYLAGASGGPQVDGFVVSGGSKRAWTTWLVGAIDKRVVAIIPIVINVLDVDATAKHHWEAMGYFSPALQDYVENGLIPGLIGSPGMMAVNRIEDPLNYRDRPAMKMPKYIINAVGDQYFPPDNTRFSYHLLPQVKRLRMIPNSKHSTEGTDISDSITAFYAAVLNRQSLPSYSWVVRPDGAIVVTSATKPAEVRLWQGNDPKARDFRVDTIGKAFTSTVLTPQADGTWVGKVEKPPAGWTAYFVEMTYPSASPYPFKFTTEVSVIPDTLPYKWKDARPITAPDGESRSDRSSPAVFPSWEEPVEASWNSKSGNRSMILIGQYDSPFVRRVGIALTTYGVAFEHRPWSVFGDTDRIAPYNPLRRVPTLVLEDGEAIVDSLAILMVIDEIVGHHRASLARTGTDGRDLLRLSGFAAGVADKGVSLLYERVLREQALPMWVERCRAQIIETLDLLEGERAGRGTTYLFDGALSHADVILTAMWSFISEALADEFDWSRWPALSAHAAACEALPVFGQVRQSFSGPAKAEA